MSEQIIDGTNIDTSVFSYSSPKPHASGAKVVNLYNKHFKQSLTLSTPLMLTWGAQEGKSQSGDPTGKWSMSLQFPSSEYTNNDAEAFLNSMKELENKIKADAMLYSKEWFGKEIKIVEVIEEKFNVMLRYPKLEKNKPELDYSRPPALTVKIPQWKGVWKPEIYDEECEPLYINGKVNTHLSPLEYLKPKVHAICVIQCGGIWFVNGKVSVTWNLIQAVVQKPKPTIEGKCFLKPKDNDKLKMKTLDPPEEDVDPDGVTSAIVQDSDDEQDDNIKAYTTTSAVEEKNVEETTVVEQPPVVVEQVAVKKKIVRKKTTTE
jgi:hypothetical protein